MKNSTISVYSKKPKKRRTQEEKVQLFNRYKASGLTVDNFCKNEGIYSSQFYLWKEQLQSTNSVSTKTARDFIQVQSPMLPASFIEITLPNGIQIKSNFGSPDILLIKQLLAC